MRLPTSVAVAVSVVARFAFTSAGDMFFQATSVSSGSRGRRGAARPRGRASRASGTRAAVASSSRSDRRVEVRRRLVEHAGDLVERGRGGRIGRRPLRLRAPAGAPPARHRRRRRLRPDRRAACGRRRAAEVCRGELRDRDHRLERVPEQAVDPGERRAERAEPGVQRRRSPTRGRSAARPGASRGWRAGRAAVELRQRQLVSAAPNSPIEPGGLERATARPSRPRRGSRAGAEQVLEAGVGEARPSWSRIVGTLSLPAPEEAARAGRGRRRALRARR